MGDFSVTAGRVAAAVPNCSMFTCEKVQYCVVLINIVENCLVEKMKIVD